MRQGFRVIDTDTHVTPSMEVLEKHADPKFKKDHWDEFKPYMRTMKSPEGRGHPLTPWTTLKIKPIPYNRVAGTKGTEEKIEKGGAGALEGRVKNIAKETASVGIQHDNAVGRLKDMDKEGVDVNVLIPGTWAPAVSALAPHLGVGARRHLVENGHRLGERATLLLGRRRGSRLFAAGVMLTLGWAFGLLLHLILTGVMRLMLRAATG